ncbi:DUF4352 domain-containing protein [Streptomyces sp. NPDC003710]
MSTRTRTRTRTRVRLVAVTVAAIGTLTITACSSGSTVVDRPKAKASTTGKGTAKGAPKDKAKETSTAPQAAKVGDTIALKGTDEGSKLDVTVIKVADPAKSSDEFMTPNPGKRYVGVQFKLVNTGTAAYSDSPSNGVQIVDGQGQQFESAFADITAGPSMSSDVRLKPGAKTLGWIVFEVPKGSKAATVQFTMDSGFAEQTGEWKLQ